MATVASSDTALFGEMGSVTALMGNGPGILLATALLDDMFSPVPLPLAGLWYTLDAAFGPPVGGPPGAVSTVLTVSGAVLDAHYGARYAGHMVAVSGRAGIDLAWSPDGKPVYLNSRQCALGFWRVQFPTLGVYTLVFAGMGSQSITVSGVAPTLTFPTITVVHPNPINRQPSKLLQLDFAGTYPAGGLDLPENVIGLYGVLFCAPQDTPLYRFSWMAGKLRAFSSGVEVSGTVVLSTRALFIGTAG